MTALEEMSKIIDDLLPGVEGHDDVGVSVDELKRWRNEFRQLEIQLTAARASLAIVQGCPLTEAVAKMREALGQSGLSIYMLVRENELRIELVDEGRDRTMDPKLIAAYGYGKIENPDQCLKWLGEEVKKQEG